jgi:hypothetical protein
MDQDVQMKKRREESEEQVEEMGGVMVRALVLQELGEFCDTGEGSVERFSPEPLPTSLNYLIWLACNSFRNRASKSHQIQCVPSLLHLLPPQASAPAGRYAPKALHRTSFAIRIVMFRYDDIVRVCRYSRSSLI